MQKEELNSWMERDLVAVLTAFFYKCDASHCKNKKVRTGSITCMSRFSTDIPTLLFLTQVALLYEILSGQHRTNAGFEFVLGPKAVESEWLSMLGSQLIPQVYRRMPQRLARRLSAGFQDKESKGQVGVVYN